jgi:hypothetical protein
MGAEYREMGREGVDWIHLAQDRIQWLGFMKMVTNLLDKKKLSVYQSLKDVRAPG